MDKYFAKSFTFILALKDSLTKKPLIIHNKQFQYLIEDILT